MENTCKGKQLMQDLLGTRTDSRCYSAYFPEVKNSSDLAGVRTCTP